VEKLDWDFGVHEKEYVQIFVIMGQRYLPVNNIKIKI
jgi:hypothetical protein